MPRKMIDCRDSPSVSGCTLTIAGEEEEVVRAAAMHAADVHGHEDTPELRDQIRSGLRDEGGGNVVATGMGAAGEQGEARH
jgi:predicted small metal-binding protein